jgi:tetratricopeptide (TPR) repeat protein
LYDLAFMSGDQAAQRHELELASGQFDEPFMRFFQGSGLYSLGKLREARAAYAQSKIAAQRLGYKEFTASVVGLQAEDEALLGNVAEARRLISEALDSSQDRETQTIAMNVLAQTGDAARSQKFAQELCGRYPENTLLNKVWVPFSAALWNLQRNQPAQALSALDVAVPYEFGTGPGTSGYAINFLRAEAFLRLKDGAKAAAEYQEILKHRGTDPLNAMYNLSHLGLGRAYALQGNTTEAKSAYQDFFAAWKDADPEIPVLKQAKIEYANLQH